MLVPFCPCSWCGADSDPISVPWSDFRPLDAKRLQQIYDKAQFLASLGPDRNPLLELPGVSQHTFWPDYMHCKYMGVDQFCSCKRFGRNGIHDSYSTLCNVDIGITPGIQKTRGNANKINTNLKRKPLIHSNMLIEVVLILFAILSRCFSP